MTTRPALGLLAVACLALGARAVAEPRPPFAITPPAVLEQPLVSHSALGATYAYLARERAQPLRMTITVMRASEVRARLGAIDTTQCMNLFIDELKRSYADLFVATQARPLGVAETTFPQFRWTGDKDGTTLTGIVSCGVLDDSYYVIDFVDALKSATTNFPAIRASLRHLVPRAASGISR